MPTRRRKEKRVGERASAWEREREPFGSSVYMFSPPPGPALCKLGQPGVFVRPEVLTPVFGLRTFLCSVFAGFSLPCLLATAILDSFLFWLPNSCNSVSQQGYIHSFVNSLNRDLAKESLG